LWQSRYKAKLVQDQGYFNQLLAYIHLNPVEAEIVDDPAQYWWSGHRELVRKVRDPLIDVDDALMGFGTSLRSARAAYVRTLRGIRETKWLGEAVSRLPWWLDKDEREIQPVDSGPYVDVQGRTTGLERPSFCAKSFYEAVLEEMGVKLQEIAGRGRKPEVVRARELLSVLGVERYGVTVKGLAEVTGRSRATVSTWVRRGAAKRTDEKSFEIELDELDRRIAGRKS
jgi:hypothetical protein